MREICKNPSGAKHLIFTIMALSIIILVCCNPSPHHHKRLNVPFEYQVYNGWCGAACVLMWAEYEGHYPSLEEIAYFIGYSGSDPYRIAQTVSYYTHENGVDQYYGSTEYQQDLAMSAQVASVDDNIPSISIVEGGHHAVIVIGFDWTNNPYPRADGVRFHDPKSSAGADSYEIAGEWKRWWFTAYNGQHAIVLGFEGFRSEGESGYIEFLNQGGTYYGGPPDYNPEGME